MSTSVSAGSVFAAAKVDAINQINQSNVVNDDNNRSIDAWSTGANARAVHGVFFFIVLVFLVVVVAIERGNPAG